MELVPSSPIDTLATLTDNPWAWKVTARYEAAWKQLREVVLAQPEGAFVFQHGGHDPYTEATAERLEHSFARDWNQIVRWDESVNTLPLCSAEDVEEITLAIEWGEVTRKTIPVRFDSSIDGRICSYCGALLEYSFDGRTFSASPCALNNDPFLLSFETNGRVVLHTDVRLLLPDDYEERESEIRREISGNGLCFSLMSRRRISQMYADLGIIQLYLGNIGPSLYQTPSEAGNEHLLIAVAGYETDGLGLSVGEPIEPEGKNLGYLHGNAHVALIDEEVYLKLGGTLPGECARVITVAPGRYRVRVHRYERTWVDRESGKPTIYARFERVA